MYQYCLWIHERNLLTLPPYLSYLRTAVSTSCTNKVKLHATPSEAVLGSLCFMLTSCLIKDLLRSFSSLGLQFLNQFILLLWRYLQNPMVPLMSSLVTQVVIHLYSNSTDYLYTHRSTPKIMSHIVTQAVLPLFFSFHGSTSKRPKQRPVWTP